MSELANKLAEGNFDDPGDDEGDDYIPAIPVRTPGKPVNKAARTRSEIAYDFFNIWAHSKEVLCRDPVAQGHKISNVSQFGGSMDEWVYYNVVDGLRALMFLWSIPSHCRMIITHYSDNYKHSDFNMDNHGAYRLANKGDLSLNGYLMISGFVLTSGLINRFRLQNHRSFPMFIVRRIARIAPMLIIASLVLKEFFNGTEMLPQCTEYYWTNMFGGGNYWTSCRIWNVSLEFQLALFAPVLTYFYLRHRDLGYILSYALIVLGLFIRYKIVKRHSVSYCEEHTWRLYQLPDVRCPEFLIGVILAFSFADERFRDAELKDSVVDVFSHGLLGITSTAEMVSRYGRVRTFDNEAEVTTITDIMYYPLHFLIQVAILLIGPLFIWEGDLMDGDWDFYISEGVAVMVIIWSEFVIAFFFAIILRFALQQEILVRGEQSRGMQPSLWGNLSKPWPLLFGNFIWYPIAQFSFSGYLMSYPMCWTAFLTIGGKKVIDDNYTYFTKLFLMAVVYSFAVGYFSCILVEKPFQSLVKAIPYEGPDDLLEVFGDLEEAVVDTAEGVGEAVGSVVPGEETDDGDAGGAPLSGYGATDSDISQGGYNADDISQGVYNDDVSHAGYNPMPDKTAGERLGYGSTEDR